jgi:hypothetical protein
MFLVSSISGMLRGPIPSHSSSYPVRGRAKVRGVGHLSSSYWPLDNNPGGGGAGSNVNGGNNGAGRGLSGPPRNDR